MGYLILGIITLAVILILGGYIVLSVMNAAMWMDDSMRWEVEMTAKDDRKNAEGYNDPTAYNAIKNVEQEQDKDDARFHQLLNMLFSLCELADFHIEGRVVLKDKRTGKVWR